MDWDTVVDIICWLSARYEGGIDLLWWAHKQ